MDLKTELENSIFIDPCGTIRLFQETLDFYVKDVNLSPHTCDLIATVLIDLEKLYQKVR